MTVEDFETHVKLVGFAVSSATAPDGNPFLVISDVAISGGRHAGKPCDVAILRTGGQPWVPQAAVHVRPHLVPMGQRNSQASPMGPDWQYLSRRFDRVPTPKGFLAHILTVLAEL